MSHTVTVGADMNPRASELHVCQWSCDSSGMTITLDRAIDAESFS